MKKCDNCGNQGWLYYVKNSEKNVEMYMKPCPECNANAKRLPSTSFKIPFFSCLFCEVKEVEIKELKTRVAGLEKMVKTMQALVGESVPDVSIYTSTDSTCDEGGVFDSVSIRRTPFESALLNIDEEKL